MPSPGLAAVGRFLYLWGPGLSLPVKVQPLQGITVELPKNAEPPESESAAQQDPQVIPVHIKV